MLISFKTIELPFKVGDTVFVNQPHSGRRSEEEGEPYPYFEAEIIRIFLDGRLEELTVIAEPVDTYELEVKTAVYELKPVGDYSDLVRMPLSISLPIKEPKLFKSEEDLLDYQRALDQVENQLGAMPAPEDRPS
ncbi:hypothetical protein GCM10027341_33040 [Spirosoma knui]